MPAPTGNKSAEKWTLEKTLERLKVIDSFSYSNDCLYLGHALYEAGCYDDLWAYWRRKWKRQYEVINLMKMIMQRFEVRIFMKMSKKEIPANVGMFALKHHYGWGKEYSEQQEIKVSKAMDQEADADLNYTPKEQVQNKQPETPQDEQPQEQLTKTPANEKPVKGKEYMLLKREQYNALNPTEQILGMAAYFDGYPPTGMKAIEFDGGYFLKC